MSSSFVNKNKSSNKSLIQRPQDKAKKVKRIGLLYHGLGQCGKGSRGKYKRIEHKRKGQGKYDDLSRIMYSQERKEQQVKSVLRSKILVTLLQNNQTSNPHYPHNPIQQYSTTLLSPHLPSTLPLKTIRMRINFSPLFDHHNPSINNHLAPLHYHPSSPSSQSSTLSMSLPSTMKVREFDELVGSYLKMITKNTVGVGWVYGGVGVDSPLGWRKGDMIEGRNDDRKEMKDGLLGQRKRGSGLVDVGKQGRDVGKQGRDVNQQVRDVNQQGRGSDKEGRGSDKEGRGRWLSKQRVTKGNQRMMNNDKRMSQVHIIPSILRIPSIQVVQQLKYDQQELALIIVKQQLALSIVRYIYQSRVLSSNRLTPSPLTVSTSTHQQPSYNLQAKHSFPLITNTPSSQPTLGQLMKLEQQIRRLGRRNDNNRWDVSWVKEEEAVFEVRVMYQAVEGDGGGQERRDRWEEDRRRYRMRGDINMYQRQQEQQRQQWKQEQRQHQRQQQQPQQQSKQHQHQPQPQLQSSNPSSSHPLYPTTLSLSPSPLPRLPSSHQSPTKQQPQQPITPPSPPNWLNKYNSLSDYHQPSQQQQQQQYQEQQHEQQYQERGNIYIEQQQQSELVRLGQGEGQGQGQWGSHVTGQLPLSLQDVAGLSPQLQQLQQEPQPKHLLKSPQQRQRQQHHDQQHHQQHPNLITFHHHSPSPSSPSQSSSPSPFLSLPHHSPLNPHKPSIAIAQSHLMKWIRLGGLQIVEWVELNNFITEKRYIGNKWQREYMRRRGSNGEVKGSDRMGRGDRGMNKIEKMMMRRRDNWVVSRSKRIDGVSVNRYPVKLRCNRENDNMNRYSSGIDNQGSNNRASNMNNGSSGVNSHSNSHSNHNSNYQSSSNTNYQSSSNTNPTPNNYSHSYPHQINPNPYDPYCYLITITYSTHHPTNHSTTHPNNPTHNPNPYPDNPSHHPSSISHPSIHLFITTILKRLTQYQQHSNNLLLSNKIIEYYCIAAKGNHNCSDRDDNDHRKNFGGDGQYQQQRRQWQKGRETVQGQKQEIQQVDYGQQQKKEKKEEKQEDKKTQEDEKKQEDKKKGGISLVVITEPDSLHSINEDQCSLGQYLHLLLIKEQLLVKANKGHGQSSLSDNQKKDKSQHHTHHQPNTTHHPNNHTHHHNHYPNNSSSHNNKQNLHINSDSNSCTNTLHQYHLPDILRDLKSPSISNTFLQRSIALIIEQVIRVVGWLIGLVEGSVGVNSIDDNRQSWQLLNNVLFGQYNNQNQHQPQHHQPHSLLYLFTITTTRSQNLPTITPPPPPTLKINTYQLINRLAHVNTNPINPNNSNNYPHTNNNRERRFIEKKDRKQQLIDRVVKVVSKEIGGIVRGVMEGKMQCEDLGELFTWLGGSQEGWRGYSSQQCKEENGYRQHHIDKDRYNQPHNHNPHNHHNYASRDSYPHPYSHIINPSNHHQHNLNSNYNYKYYPNHPTNYPNHPNHSSFHPNQNKQTNQSSHHSNPLLINSLFESTLEFLSHCNANNMEHSNNQQDVAIHNDNDDRGNDSIRQVTRYNQTYQQLKNKACTRFSNHLSRVKTQLHHDQQRILGMLMNNDGNINTTHHHPNNPTTNNQPNPTTNNQPINNITHYHPPPPPLLYFSPGDSIDIYQKQTTLKKPNKKRSSHNNSIGQVDGSMGEHKGGGQLQRNRRNGKHKGGRLEGVREVSNNRREYNCWRINHQRNQIKNQSKTGYNNPKTRNRSITKSKTNTNKNNTTTSAKPPKNKNKP